MIIGFYIDKYFSVLGDTWYVDKKSENILLKYKRGEDVVICFYWNKWTKYPVSDMEIYACIEFLKMLQYEP